MKDDMNHHIRVFSNNTSSSKACLNVLTLEPNPSATKIPHVLHTFISRRDSRQPHPKIITIVLTVCLSPSQDSLEAEITF